MQIPSFTSRSLRLLSTRAVAVAVTAGVVLIAACSAPPPPPPPTATAAPATPTAAPATPTATAAPSAGVVKVATVGTFGASLVDASGKTLYTFANDTAGKSACNGTCAATWPALAAPAGDLGKVDGATGAFSVITRDDGSKQVAYAGRPLYRFAGDAAAGDAKGNGLANGAWKVAAAAAPAASATPAAGSATPASTATAPKPAANAGGPDY